MTELIELDKKQKRSIIGFLAFMLVIAVLLIAIPVTNSINAHRCENCSYEFTTEDIGARFCPGCGAEKFEEPEVNFCDNCEKVCETDYCRYCGQKQTK